MATKNQKVTEAHGVPYSAVGGPPPGEPGSSFRGGDRQADPMQPSVPRDGGDGSPTSADVTAQNRPQTTGSAAQRLGTGRGSLPADGRVASVPTATPRYRQGTGSVDDDGRPVGGRPFKLKGG